MTKVNLINKEALSELDSIVDCFFNELDYDNPEYRVCSKDYGVNMCPSYFTSEEHLRYKKDMGLGHSGFPEEHMACPMTNIIAKNKDPKWKAFEERCRITFSQFLGAHSAALLNYYPPNGSVGWHTNWNAPAHQILFTWSRTGDGFFNYYDNKADKVVTIKDVPGWQCHHYHFGGKDDPDNHCWHSAFTNCDRFTMAYKFMSGTGEILRDNLIQELENE